MPNANCPKCENNSFIDWQYESARAGTVIMIICSACGAVVGTVKK